MTPPPGGTSPEQVARKTIDAGLVEAGWVVQRRDEMNLAAGRGVAVCEFKLAPGHGFADYLLFVDGKAVGVLEAKPAGHTLSGVEVQAEKYSTGLPAGLDPPVEPLPFLYLSTGAVTKFTNLLDPDPRSRRIFQVHQPGTLAEWLGAETLDAWVQGLRLEPDGRGRFDGTRLHVESVPRLPTFPARWVMEDPRGRPYFVFWINAEGGLSYRVRMVQAADRGAVTLSTPEQTRCRIEVVRRPMPRRGGMALLYRCPRCRAPRRYLYGLALIGGRIVAQIEGQTKVPSIATLEKLAKALKVKVGRLLE